MLHPYVITVGSDPELFLLRSGKIIGSEKLIPEAGLDGFVVRDGIQIELNPMASTGTTTLAAQLAICFGRLNAALREYNQPGREPISLCWNGTVDVTREEFDSLSPECRVLGCQPSKNIYGARPINVDRRTYAKRSAGGHMHFGLARIPELWNTAAGVDYRDDIVPLLDIFVGNTLVLLDRDPNASIRRENYGRAGEYRHQPHGLEYRTPSNFWLRNYSIMNLAFSLANLAISVAFDSKLGPSRTQGAEMALIDGDHVVIDNVIKAIDTNDYDLAKENLLRLKPFFEKYVPPISFGLSAHNIDKFLNLTDVVRQNGLEMVFPEDPMLHWMSGRRIEFPALLDSI